MTRNEDAVLKIFNEYAQAFQSLQARDIAAYLHIPCMFIAPQGVAVLSSSADRDALLSQIIEGLKARG